MNISYMELMLEANVIKLFNALVFWMSSVKVVHTLGLGHAQMPPNLGTERRA